LFKNILNHTEFHQLNLIHSSMYIDMLFHLYIFFTMFCVCLLCLFHSSVVFQHFSKTEKQGWTRWPSWFLTNPVWHSARPAPLCLHWSTIAPLHFHLF